MIGDGIIVMFGGIETLVMGGHGCIGWDRGAAGRRYRRDGGDDVGIAAVGLRSVVGLARHIAVAVVRGPGLIQPGFICGVVAEDKV